jgi:hypothetical protein
MSHRLSSRARALGISCVIAMTLAAVAATPVAAANNIRIHVELGLGYFSGTNAGANNTIKIEWRSSDGSLKSKQAIQSGNDGLWEFFDFGEVMEPGDTVATTVGTSTRTYTVKPVTLSVDRVSDIASGDAPAGTSVRLDVRDFVGGFAAPILHDRTVTADGSGHYSVDFSSGADPVNLRGWDGVAATQSNSRGDTTAYGMNVDAIRVWIGRANFDLVGDPGTRVDLSLTRSASVLFHETMLVGPDAYLLESSFVDANGARVRAAAGDEIGSDQASDASFTIPDVTLTVAKLDDKITVNCGLGPNRGVLVRTYNQTFGAFGERSGYTNSSGNFVARFAHELNIKSGFKVEVRCMLASGDIVGRLITVE